VTSVARQGKLVHGLAAASRRLGSRTQPEAEARKTRLEGDALALSFRCAPVTKRPFTVSGSKMSRHFAWQSSPLFEIALVRLDHVASLIVNVNHSIM
jgi:hypothetical protein